MKRTAIANQITDRLAELSDLVRVRLLRLLEREELSVGEIASVVQLPQSTVSRHLKQLADGGWLLRRSVGTASYYRLVQDDLLPTLAALWVTVRDAIEQTAELEEDDRRLGSVLSERRRDSVGFFGRLAGEWDELRQSLFGRAFTANALLGLLPSDWIVADLGCGTGNAAERLAPFVGGVIAVDQSGPMLDAARKRLGTSSGVEFRQGELENLPIDDGGVDAAICLLVLHHVEDPALALADIRRVLRRDRGGGVVLVVDMIEHDRTEYRHTLGHRHLGFSRSRIEGLIHDAGFRTTGYRELPSDPDGRGPGLFVATGHL